MRIIKLMFGILMVMAVQNESFAAYDQALVLTAELESTLTDLTSAMQEGDEARARALAASYGQKYLALDKTAMDLAANDRLRFAVLEDKIRMVTERHLSVLQTIRGFVPEADRVGIDRSLQVYLNARERSYEVVGHSILRETRQT